MSSGAQLVSRERGFNDGVFIEECEVGEGARESRSQSRHVMRFPRYPSRWSSGFINENRVPLWCHTYCKFVAFELV